MLEKVKYEGGSLLKYIELLVRKAREYASDSTKSFKNIRPASMYVVVRSLGQVAKKLKNMEQTNFRHRQKMSKLKFEELPDASTEPEKIVNKGQLNQYKKIIPNGKNLGIKITYLEQDKPRGLPDAFVIGEKFIGKDNVCLLYTSPSPRDS